MTVVRPYSQWGIALIGEDDRITGFSEKPRLDYWINGGFFVCEPAFLDVRRRRQRARARAAGAHRGRGRLGAYRHEGFWDCMDTYKDAVTLNDLWSPPRRRGGSGTREEVRGLMGVSLVTGARGFVGGWLAKALLERGETVVSFDRKRTERAPLGDRRCSGSRTSWSRSRAISSTTSWSARLLDEHAVDTVFHLAAEVIVATVQASPVRGFETNVRGTWTLLEACLERTGSSGWSSPPPTRPTAHTTISPTARTTRCSRPLRTRSRRRRPT